MLLSAVCSLPHNYGVSCIIMYICLHCEHPFLPLYPPSQQIICIVKGLLCYCQLLFICPYVASYIFLSPFTSSPCIMCNFVHLPPLWTPISPPLPTHPTDFWKVKELLCHCQLLIHFSLCCIIYKPLYIFDHFLCCIVIFIFCIVSF